MDIAAVSMRMASTDFQTSASISMLKKAMDTEEMQAEALAVMLQSAVPSHLGNVIDTFA